MATTTPPLEYPFQDGSPVMSLPMGSEGPADFFPPVCLQTHWDPTRILRWTLPDQYVGQPLDPRPWTRICMEYTTAGEQEAAPGVSPAVVMPSGGQFYPPSRYQASVDKESQLRRLDRPLGTCETDQWVPRLKSDMFNARILVPDRQNPVNPMRIQEVAYPQALLRSGPYDCRDQMDKVNTAMASDFLFNNATKQDRYKVLNKNGTRPAPPTATLLAAPERLRPDLTLNATRATPEEGTYERAPLRAPDGTVRAGETSFAAWSGVNQRADLVANATVPQDLGARIVGTATPREQAAATDSQVAAWRQARGMPPTPVTSGRAGVL